MDELVPSPSDALLTNSFLGEVSQTQSAHFSHESLHHLPGLPLGTPADPIPVGSSYLYISSLSGVLNFTYGQASFVTLPSASFLSFTHTHRHRHAHVAFHLFYTLCLFIHSTNVYWAPTVHFSMVPGAVGTGETKTKSLPSGAKVKISNGINDRIDGYSGSVEKYCAGK